MTRDEYSVEFDDTSSSLVIKPFNLLYPRTHGCVVSLCSLLFSHVRADTTKALLMQLFYYRLAPSRLKSSRKVLIGR